MRRALCVGKYIFIVVMCHALNRTPVLAVWIPRMLNFWNQLLLCGQDDLLAQSLHSQIDKPDSWGHQIVQLINEVQGGHTPPIDTYGRPNHIQLAMMTTIVKALVAREYDRDWAPIQDLARRDLAYTSGSLVRACPDDAWLGFLRFKSQTWLMGPCPDHRDRAQHKYTFAANANTLCHVHTLFNFMCANSWLNCGTGFGRWHGSTLPY
jgi:hypothetical protein